MTDDETRRARLLDVAEVQARLAGCRDVQSIRWRRRPDKLGVSEG
ncbi:MAG: hypothetical protein V4479_04690 [Actinomycetota bacterium]